MATKASDIIRAALDMVDDGIRRLDDVVESAHGEDAQAVSADGETYADERWWQTQGKEPSDGSRIVNSPIEEETVPTAKAAGRAMERRQVAAGSRPKSAPTEDEIAEQVFRAALDEVESCILDDAGAFCNDAAVSMDDLGSAGIKLAGELKDHISRYHKNGDVKNCKYANRVAKTAKQLGMSPSSVLRAAQGKTGGMASPKDQKNDPDFMYDRGTGEELWPSSREEGQEGESGAPDDDGADPRWEREGWNTESFREYKGKVNDLNKKISSLQKTLGTLGGKDLKKARAEIESMKAQVEKESVDYAMKALGKSEGGAAGELAEIAGREKERGIVGPATRKLKELCGHASEKVSKMAETMLESIGVKSGDAPGEKTESDGEKADGDASADMTEVSESELEDADKGNEELARRANAFMEKLKSDGNDYSDLSDEKAEQMFRDAGFSDDEISRIREMQKETERAEHEANIDDLKKRYPDSIGTIDTLDGKLQSVELSEEDGRVYDELAGDTSRWDEFSAFLKEKCGFSDDDCTLMEDLMTTPEVMAKMDEAQPDGSQEKKSPGESSTEKPDEEGTKEEAAEAGSTSESEGGGEHRIPDDQPSDDEVKTDGDGKPESIESHWAHCKANPKENCPFLKANATEEQIAALKGPGEEHADGEAQASEGAPKTESQPEGRPDDGVVDRHGVKMRRRTKGEWRKKSLEDEYRKAVEKVDALKADMIKNGEVRQNEDGSVEPLTEEAQDKLMAALEDADRRKDEMDGFDPSSVDGQQNGTEPSKEGNEGQQTPAETPAEASTEAPAEASTEAPAEAPAEDPSEAENGGESEESSPEGGAETATESPGGSTSEGSSRQNGGEGGSAPSAFAPDKGYRVSMPSGASVVVNVSDNPAISKLQAEAARLSEVARNAADGETRMQAERSLAEVVQRRNALIVREARHIEFANNHPMAQSFFDGLKSAMSSMKSMFSGSEGGRADEGQTSPADGTPREDGLRLPAYEHAGEVPAGVAAQIDDARMAFENAKGRDEKSSAYDRYRSLVDYADAIREGGGSDDDRSDKAEAEYETPLPAPTVDIKPPPMSLLDPKKGGESDARYGKEKGDAIRNKLASRINGVGNVESVNVGPSATTVTISVGDDFSIGKAKSMMNDLASTGVTVGSIEYAKGENGKIKVRFTNSKMMDVGFADIVDSDEFKKASRKPGIVVAVGKDSEGRPIVRNLAKMPHGIITGETKSGKSVCLQSLINSAQIGSDPKKYRQVCIDGKGQEFGEQKGSPFNLFPPCKSPKDVLTVLKSLNGIMEDRAKKLGVNLENWDPKKDSYDGSSSRNLDDYNGRVAEGDRLPYIGTYIDELATYSPDKLSGEDKAVGEEIMNTLDHLLAKGRSVGLNFILSTQRGDVASIPGRIQANAPARFTFKAAGDDHKATKEAKSLAGEGDMIITDADGTQTRGRGCYISDREVKEIPKYYREQVGNADS